MSASSSFYFHLWWVWCSMERQSKNFRDTICPTAQCPPCLGKAVPSKSHWNPDSFLPGQGLWFQKKSHKTILLPFLKATERKLLEWEYPKHCFLASNKDLLFQSWLNLPASPAGNSTREKRYRSCSDCS